MDLCFICNKEYKNLGSHVRASHQMSMDEYNKQKTGVTLDDALEEVEPSSMEEIIESEKVGEKEEKGKITLQQKEQRIFNPKSDVSEEMTVGEYLKVKHLALKELNSIVKRFKDGSNIPAMQSLSRNLERGKRKAGELAAKGASTLDVTDTHIAEALTTFYGYECTHTTPVSATNRKTWHLRKV